MNHSTYLDSNGDVHVPSAAHNLSLNLDPNSITHALQQPFSYHHPSPVTEQRQDSMFPTSPLVTPRPLGTPYQYQSGLQPCTNGQIDRYSHNDHSHLPVNNGMSRSRSQYSSTSSDQHPCYHSPRRASQGSFSRNPTGAPYMSRSYSSASATQYATLQHGASQQCLQHEEHYDRQPSDLSPNTRYEPTDPSLTNEFHFDVNDIIGGSEGRDDSHVGTFGHTTCHIE